MFFSKRFSTSSKISAWLVHLYTATGGLFGFYALIMASQNRFAEAFLGLMFSAIIDATDGIMARKVDVKRQLPNFDGAMMDNVIDIFTYAWVPFFIIWKMGILPSPFYLIPPIFASLYAYGQTDMKTDDNFFLGFPTYWNVIALYFYLLQPSSISAGFILLIFSYLSFVPTRYLYPSRNKYMHKTFWILGFLWFLMIIWAFLAHEVSKELALVSLYYPFLYMVVSFHMDRKIRKAARALRNKI